MKILKFIYIRIRKTHKIYYTRIYIYIYIYIYMYVCIIYIEKNIYNIYI